ncbi:MAG TPA: signal peptidase II [Candidatus Angelobacter sp.]|nr:signal peptidase II [Candidatus Angelobacter sp.]
MEASIDRDASTRNALLLAGVAVVLYVADQVTKALVAANLGVGERVDVIGDVVQLWHVRNTGAAFSLLPGATWLFVPMHLVAVAMVAYFHRQFRTQGPWIHVILAAILAGGLGNLTDRVRLGYVTDFVSVGIGDLRWPAFNVADPSLVIGIILLVGYLTFLDPRRAEAAAE